MKLEEYLASITVTNTPPPPPPASLHNVYNVVITKEIRLYTGMV